MTIARARLACCCYLHLMGTSRVHPPMCSLMSQVPIQSLHQKHARVRVHACECVFVCVCECECVSVSACLCLSLSGNAAQQPMETTSCHLNTAVSSDTNKLARSHEAWLERKPLLLGLGKASPDWMVTVAATSASCSSVRCSTVHNLISLKDALGARPTHTHTQAHTHTCTHAHMYTHTHTHTHTWTYRGCWIRDKLAQRESTTL